MAFTIRSLRNIHLSSELFGVRRLRLPRLSLPRLSFQLILALAAVSMMTYVASYSLGGHKAYAQSAKAAEKSQGTRYSDEDPVGGAKAALSTTAESWSRSTDTKFAYNIQSGFDSFANEKEQSQFFGMALGADFRARLLSSLTFRAKAGVNLSSGYAQSRFGDNLGASGVRLEEASLNLRAINSDTARLYFSAGALAQHLNEIRYEMLIDEQAFPGLRQMLVFGSEKQTRIRVWAQQMIPTSKTLSTKAVDAELMPTYLSESIELSVRPLKDLKLLGQATHFAFHSLPSAVALQSQLYGNTTVETGPNTARFKYGFEGYSVGGLARYDFMSSFGAQFGGYLIQNMQAPEGYRNAQVLQGDLIFGLENEIELTVAGGTFFAEDDVTPGFYNSAVTGHNNRQGQFAKLEADFKRQRFKLKAAFVDADTINFNINQTRQQAISVGFETFYELF